MPLVHKEAHLIASIGWLRAAVLGANDGILSTASLIVGVAKETAELKTDPAGELAELAAIYQGRGLSAILALQVAQEMRAGDALAAHKRDELGITAEMAANPIQAGLVSVATFALGASLPLIVVGVLPEANLLVGVSVTTIVALVALGATGAHIGGAPLARGAARVTIWGALAMLVTALVGWVFGTVA